MKIPKPSDIAAFGLGAVIALLCWLALALVLSAGCTVQGPHNSFEKFRIDGACFVVFNRGSNDALSAVQYPCPAAREELVLDGAPDGGVL